MRSAPYTYALMLICSVISVQEVSAGEWNFTIARGRSGGKHLYAIGAKDGLIIGSSNTGSYGGGSRLTYSRDFAYWRTGVVYSKGNLEFQADLRFAPGRVNMKETRNEDFILHPYSKVRGAKVSVLEGRYYDSPYTFSNENNYADGKQDTGFQEYRGGLIIRYFPGIKTDRKATGFYWSGGFRYTYFKYYLSNNRQWGNLLDPLNPRFGFVPGRIGSLAASQQEVIFGFGYRITKNAWLFDISVQPLLGQYIGRDFHKLRNLNIFSSAQGSGFLFESRISYDFAEKYRAGIRYTANRFFSSKSEFRNSGGLTLNDRLGRWAGPLRSTYVNIKEESVELFLQFLL